MKIIFWANGNRGISCLKALCEKNISIEWLIVHPKEESTTSGSLEALAVQYGISFLAPPDPNSKEIELLLKEKGADLFILAGYGKILKKNIIEIPKLMCVNLHGGELPKYRGSSPLNWALLKGEKSFTLSIIRVNEAIDGGDILLERTFDISIHDTIRDLHGISNHHFPSMLLELLPQIEKGTIVAKPQDRWEGSYYPLRFPEDGFILWDMLTAEQIHNAIRALTDPYPGAFTFFKGRKVRLLSSELEQFDYFGEPGRIYKISKQGLLICAKDKCLWLQKAQFEDTGELLITEVKRYERLSTIKEFVMQNQKMDGV